LVSLAHSFSGKRRSDAAGETGVELTGDGLSRMPQDCRTAAQSVRTGTICICNILEQSEKLSPFSFLLKILILSF
jgi:hypothetical protein